MNRLKGLKLKFDVTDNPELSEAICDRLVELDGRSIDIDYTRSYVFVTDGGQFSTYSNETIGAWKDSCKPATLDDLYHLPETHTISFDGEDDIEISAESFAALKKSLIK